MDIVALALAAVALAVALGVRAGTRKPRGAGVEALPEDDPRKRKPDITLAESKLGWRPTVAFERGVELTIEHFRSVGSPQ